MLNASAYPHASMRIELITCVGLPVVVDVVLKVTKWSRSYRLMFHKYKLPVDHITNRIIDNNIRFQPWVPLPKHPNFELLLGRRSHTINYIKKFFHMPCLSKSDSNRTIGYYVWIWWHLLLKRKEKHILNGLVKNSSYSVPLNKWAFDEKGASYIY